MPSLTDGAIRKAIERAGKLAKHIALTDGEGRSTGRLALVIKPMPTRITADWMAQQWRDGRRTRSKIGSYPAMGLAEAREVFKRDFADVISKGASIKSAGDGRLGTVADLFAGYVKHLKTENKPSSTDVEACLEKVGNILGQNRVARDITADDVVGVLRPIFQRGKRAMADHVRSYIRAAYTWAIKSELDYRSASPRRFKLHTNPAAGIPTEPKTPGTRWLNDEEFIRLYAWLECPDVPVHPALAAELIKSIIPNRFGWYFPSAKDPSKPVSAATLYSFMWRQRERDVIPIVTNRDLRRTWKTLAGKAGLSKEIRDRIQNHALQDVSSKSYDRWNYMPEKREAMEKWNAFVTTLLEKKSALVAA